MQTAGEILLTLDVKSKKFASQTVLADIHLTLHSSERIALHGRSGIGKSTLLRIIAGLDRHFTGTRQAPDNIALMFQTPNLLAWRSVYDNLHIFHPSAGRTEIEDILAEVGLADKVAHFPTQLSLGQARRLALARVFLSRCDLILLDEPFVSLDSGLKDEMLALTLNLLDKSNSALILVTHAQEEAQKLGACCYQLSGSPATLASG